MLQFVSANGILRDGGIMWTPVNIGSMQLFQIYRQYTHVLVQIYDTDLHRNGWVDLYKLPFVLRSSPMTMDQYFANGAVISYLPDEPGWDYELDTVRFYFASAFSYQSRGVNNNFPADEDLLPGQMIDALLYHPDVKPSTYSRIFNNCLVTCNGLVHRIGVVPEGIMVYEAGKTTYRSEDNRFGFLSFEELGGIKTVPMTDDMFIYPTDDEQLEQAVYLELPDGSALEDKSVFLVCAGKLYLDVSPISIVSSKRIKIDLRRLDLLNLYMDVWQSMDLSECPLTRDPVLEDRVVVAEFDSDAVIRWFLKFAATFLVVIPRPNVSVRYQMLDNVDQLGLYRMFRDANAQLPVSINRRRMAEYTIQEYYDRYTLTVPYYWLSHPMWWTTSREDQMGTNYALLRDQTESNLPKRPAEAYLVYIQSPHVD